MRKQANIRELKEEINNLRQQLNDYKAIASLGHWQLNFTTGDFNCSQELHKLLDIECTENNYSYDWKISAIHPDDQETVKLAIKNTLKSDRHGLVEYRIVDKKNNVKYIREWLFIAHDVNGNPIQISGVLTDITSQKTNEKALISSEQRFRSLLNNTTDAVSIADRKGRIIYGNPSFVKMLGYKSIDEVIELTAANLIGSSDIKVFYKKLVKKGFVKNYEAILVKKDGSKLYVLISSKIIYPGDVDDPIIESFIKDITELKEAELKIIRHNQHLERLVKIAQIKTASSKELIDIALKEGLELTKSELGFIDLYNPKTKVLTIHAWSKAAMGRSRLFKKQVQLKVEEASLWDELIKSKKPFIINNINSEEVWGKVISKIRLDVKKYLLVPVALDNEIVAITSMINKETDYDETDAQQLALLMDTIWKRLDKQKVNEDLIKAKEKAEEADKLKSSFLANMSHEIRTPLNVIVGFANLLNERGLTEEEIDYHVKLISQGANQLSQIINDIIDISKIETGQISVKYDPVDIQKLVNEAIQLYSPQAKDKQITVTSDFKGCDENIVIKTDEQKLKQILNNLISNAVKFTSDGEISISAYNEEKDLVIKIKDTGIGIPLNKQGKIFDRFRTGEIDLKRKYSGTGLGLPISKGLAELMDGKIWVESESGVGSTFYVAIPNKKPKKPVNKLTKKLSATLAGKTILIAEDETFNFYYLETLLKDADIIHAPNGEKAIELVKENPAIDLILMDIKMPLMNGFDAAKIIKGLNPNIPIIAQSAFASANEINRAKELGFEDYVTKPINSKHLMHTIYDALGQLESQKDKSVI